MMKNYKVSIHTQNAVVVEYITARSAVSADRKAYAMSEKQNGSYYTVYRVR